MPRSTSVGFANTEETRSTQKREVFAMKMFLFATVLALSTISRADEKQYFVKTATGFQKVDKTQAVLGILQNKSTVLACSEQRLTKKLTLKTISKNDD